MKKITLMIDEALLQTLGITNSSDDAAVAVAIKNAAEKARKVDTLQETVNSLKVAKENAEANLEAERAAIRKKRVNGILTQALTENRMTKEAADQLREDYADKPESLEKIVNAMKPYKTMTGGLEHGEAVPDNIKGKTWDELFENGQLPTVRNKFPDLFKELHKAKFGTEPK